MTTVVTTTESASINFAACARACGVHPTHIGRIFKGETKPSLTLAGKIAHHLGISIDQLTEQLRSIGGVWSEAA